MSRFAQEPLVLGRTVGCPAPSLAAGRSKIGTNPTIVLEAGQIQQPPLETIDMDRSFRQGRIRRLLLKLWVYVQIPGIAKLWAGISVDRRI